MASEKISAMPAAAALDGTESAPLVQGGGNVKVSVGVLSTFVVGNGYAATFQSVNVGGGNLLLGSDGSLTAEGLVTFNAGIVAVGTTSLDAGTITTNGGGNLIVGGTLTGNSGLFVTGAGTSLDGGAVTTDGSGNFTANGSTSTGPITCLSVNVNDGNILLGDDGSISCNGPVTFSSGGTFTLSTGTFLCSSGQIILNSLPTSDPGNPGQLYQSAGVLMVSL